MPLFAVLQGGSVQACRYPLQFLGLDSTLGRISGGMVHWRPSCGEGVIAEDVLSWMPGPAVASRLSPFEEVETAKTPCAGKLHLAAGDGWCVLCSPFDLI